MKVIPPLAITDAILISSTEAEPTAGSPQLEDVWNAGYTYALGAEVIETTYHRKYESLQAANVGNALPDYAAGETATDWWIDIGPTNKWAMFDTLRNTKTYGASPLTVVLEPGQRIDAIALLGLEGTSVTVSVDSAVGSPSENYFSASEDLSTREVADWYEYFFEPFTFKKAVVFFDVPPYSDAFVTATITNTDGQAACGALVVGLAQELGDAQMQAENDALNFSTVERDQFGEAALVQRRTVPKTKQEILVDKGRVNAIRLLREALNAQPAVWSGLGDADNEFFEALLILGFYRRFTITLSDPWCRVSLELEEI